MKYIFVILILIAAGVLWLAYDRQGGEVVNPPQEEVLWHNASTDDINVTSPQPNATVSRSFVLSGSARGGWFFEASFPYEILDASGNQIHESFVMAEGEWMTSEFVPFSTTITVPGTYTGPARLVLHRDNASGLPEHDKSVSIPIVIR